MKSYTDMTKALDDADDDQREDIIDPVLERLIATGDPEAASVIDWLLHECDVLRRNVWRLSE